MPLSYIKGDGQGAVISKATLLLSTYKMLSNILLSSVIPYTDDITADHGVDTDITGQLLIIYCAFIKYLRKNENGVSNKSL